MSEQGSLFSSSNHDGNIEYKARPKQLARPVHGETSFEAALEILQNGTFSERCEKVYELVCENPGLTGAELDSRGGYLHRELSKRLADVRRTGKIKRGEKRKCSVGGNNAFTWWPKNET